MRAWRPASPSLQSFSSPRIVVVVLLANGFGRQNDAVLPASDWAAFSPSVARQLADSLDALPEGVARRALLEIAVSARTLLLSAGNLLDSDHERTTRDHVERLVEASCDSAIELARLDDALAGRRRDGRSRRRETDFFRLREASPNTTCKRGELAPPALRHRVDERIRRVRARRRIDDMS